MLGWEFPPHISGGLGTACKGIVEGITHHGVEVLFVLPRAAGDEFYTGAEILGVTTGPTLRVETVAVPSSLVPYAQPTPTRNADSPRRLAGVARRAWSRRIRGVTAEILAGDLSGGASPTEFVGGYGPDLMGEVARFTRAVAATVGAAPFEVVHAHDWMTFPAGMAIARARGVPLVVHIHASEHDRSGGGVPDPEVMALEQLGIDAAARVICVSQYTAQRLQEAYRVDAERLRVVHNAVASPERAVPRIADGEGEARDPVVLFLGRVTGQKGPAYFLEAAARVLSLRPEVKFVMSGAGDMLPAMVELSARLGIGRSVHFTGFLQGKDVQRIFAIADVYVMPSVSEPFGIAPLEAMALDVPVIVSRQSGVAEVLTHALKVDFWDVEDLANKILALLAHPSLRHELVAHGRGEVGDMRWEARGAAIKAVYEELLA